MSGLFTDERARLISPVLGIGAVLAFALPFAGVGIKVSTYGAFLGSYGATATSQADQKCLSAMGGWSFLSYTGFGVAVGSTPTSNNSLPSACAGSSLGASAAQPTPGQGKVAWQPYQAAAVLFAAVALLAAVVPSRRRNAAVAASAFLAFVLLLVARARLVDAILGSDSSLAYAGSFLDFQFGIGFIAVLALTGVLALYSLIAALRGVVWGVGRPYPGGILATPQWPAPPA